MYVWVKLGSLRAHFLPGTSTQEAVSFVGELFFWLLVPPSPVFPLPGQSLPWLTDGGFGLRYSGGTAVMEDGRTVCLWWR